MRHLINIFDATVERYPLLRVDSGLCNIAINHALELIDIKMAGSNCNTSIFSIPAHLHAEQIRSIIGHFLPDFQKLHELWNKDREEYEILHEQIAQRFAALDLGVDLSTHQMITLEGQISSVCIAGKTADQIALELLNLERNANCFYEKEYDIYTIKQMLYKIWSDQLLKEGLTSLYPLQVAHVLDYATAYTGYEKDLKRLLYRILDSSSECQGCALEDYASVLAQAISKR